MSDLPHLRVWVGQIENTAENWGNFSNRTRGLWSITRYSQGIHYQKLVWCDEDGHNSHQANKRWFSCAMSHNTQISGANICPRNEGMFKTDHVKTGNQMSEQPEIRRCLGENFGGNECHRSTATSCGQRSVRKSGLPLAQIHQRPRHKSISSFVKEIQKNGWIVGKLWVSWGTQVWMSHSVPTQHF